MKSANFLFTSESVTEGHPDKVADQISDHILDRLIEQDPKSRVACETLVTTGMAMIAGEITTTAYVDIPEVVRETIKDIGYKNSSMGFDWETCAVLSTIDKQSHDIAIGVDTGEGLFKDQGAGDQGLMFGYAMPDWRDGFRGWEYPDTISDDNQVRRALAGRAPDDASDPVEEGFKFLSDYSYFI